MDIRNIAIIREQIARRRDRKETEVGSNNETDKQKKRKKNEKQGWEDVIRRKRMER